MVQQIHASQKKVPPAALQPEIFWQNLGVKQESSIEWIRPGNIRQHADISRTLLYELVRDGMIKSRVIRRPGNIRGVRLISVESIRQFIESQPEA